MNHLAETTKQPTPPFLNLITKPCVLTIFTTALMGFSISAKAGGWLYCSSNFSLDNRTYNECQINFPTLDTGNDTQTNLYLLLADKGLIDFDIPNTHESDSYYAHDFPLNLPTLRQTAVNEVKNPNQNFLEQSKKSNYAEYCNSFYTGEEALKDALKIDTKLTSKERLQLMQFRQAIRSECANSFGHDTSSAESTSTFPLKWSTNAQPYADYIMATQLFYLGEKSDFDSAHNLYSALINIKTDNNAGLAWLVDTANYMLIRTGINRIYQHGMGDYRYKSETVDPRLFSNTQKVINTYLSRFKDGHYTASARGLQRRLYWLADRQDKLIDEIEWQIDHTNSLAFNLDSRVLPAEIEQRVFFANFDEPLNINDLNNPILLTSFALYRLRPADSFSSIKPLTLAELKQLKPKFKERTDLYQYLIATYYFVQENNPKLAIKYLPTTVPTSEMSYSRFSQYVLKAKALQQTGDINEANAIWDRLHQLPKQPFQNRITELALALQADQTNDYSKFFGNNATVQSQTLKMRVIKYSADPVLLRQIADRHSVTDTIGAEARYALLTKSLLQGRYADYLTYRQNYLPKDAQKYLGFDSEDEKLKYLPTFSEFNWQGKQISPNINCQDLTKTVTRLSQNPKDRLQTLCLAEFMNDSNLTYYLEDYDNSYHSSDQNDSGYRYPYLGDIPSRFDGQALNRLNIYQSTFNSNQDDELSAYALHRAIGCFASSGRNHCSDENVDMSVRKAWFKRLKSDFKNTNWAKNQKYYW
ncbi:MAG: hypothetical protein ACTH7W_04040 [Psychrobacter sp.]|uniref:hypothetical protein n=3 Tax=unclassified Psychrobacter TaxID=196806 RepID=UPI0017885E2C|nr:MULTISPECIES: hypothetical protein [unclassified Psychrobacter]MBE0442215.1 hypothetical protein [Psychrobacter sp. FME13]